MWRNLASSTPEMASLKFRMALPNVLPNSGSRRGPKMSKTMPKSKRCSPEIPNIGRVYRRAAQVSILLVALSVQALVLVMVLTAGHGLGLRVSADELQP